MNQNNEHKQSRITGLVAELVSDRELILARGSDHGVKTGMYFAILDPRTNGIKDPETGEELGGFRTVKIVVRAVEVAPKLMLARTFRSQTVNIGGSAAGLSSIANMINPPNYVEKVETLRFDDSSPRRIDPSQSVVAVGDPFEEVSPEEAEGVRSISLWT